MCLALKMREAQQWFIYHVHVPHRGYTLPCKNLKCQDCHQVQGFQKYKIKRRENNAAAAFLDAF